MTDSGRPVLVGVDGSSFGLMAARLAAREAALRDSPLRVVHCFVWPTYQVPHYSDLRREAEHAVHEAVAAVRVLHPTMAVSGHVLDGEPGPVLREESRGAALAVLGRSDPGHCFFAAESVVEYLAARAECPVMVARRARQADGPVLVGVDGSPDSANAMRFALVEAAARQTDLVAVYVEPGLSDGPLAAPLAQARQVAGPVKVEPRWIDGEPGAALVNESAAGQLMVVGARGHLRTLLGTVSYALLRNAHCPVVVVRGRPPAAPRSE